MNEQPSKTATPRFTKKRIVLVVAVLLFAAVIGLLVANHEWTPMPVYQGKTAREWMRAADASDPVAAMDAFQKMGSNAAPFLLRELEGEDTAWDKLYERMYPKLPMRIQARLSLPMDRRERWIIATIALEQMNDREMIPEVLRIMSKGDSEQRHMVIGVLYSVMGPEDTNCIPTLVNCLNSTNSTVLIAAADMLERLNSGKLAIAKLTNSLSSTNSMVRLKCLDRLSRLDVANSNEWHKMFTNEPAWKVWQGKVQAGKLLSVLLPGQE